MEDSDKRILLVLIESILVFSPPVLAVYSVVCLVLALKTEHTTKMIGYYSLSVICFIFAVIIFVEWIRFKRKLDIKE